ncbi:MAG: FecR domain-containing protein [Candidatus Eremiobacteraeota bacterium]|nr:FecR domain-containing protein [Candidatus Eremiobacteraeota bacterium]MCW5866204.1 FecR domain-containing protein [Candidatus Eremiobacteraeota bacterium]
MDKHQWHSPESQAASDYVEGHLKDRRLFEEHLDECTRCRLDVEALQRMRGQKRTWAEEEPYQRPRTYKPLFSGLALALPILLVLLGLYLAPRRPPVPPPARARPVKVSPQWETGASTRILTIDGQTVRLGPHSRLERVGPGRLRLTSGQVRVQEKKRRLDLETEQVEIQPTGTDFEVFHAKGLTRVHLFSGSLRVRQRSDGQVFVLDAKQREWPYPTAAL